MKKRSFVFILTIIFTIFFLLAPTKVSAIEDPVGTTISIQKFGVLPGNTAEVNRANLQKAIDWASPRGAALFIEPVENPYEVASGIILKKNV